jgi:hypothetical protein
MNDHSRPNGLDPLHILRYATEVLPATRWAVGVVGLAAAAAIILALGQSPVFGVVGVAGIFVAMVALFVFSRLLETAAAATKLVAAVLMWFMVLVFMATVSATFTSAFFNAPWPLRERLFASAVAAQAESAGLPEVAAAVRGLSQSALKKLVDLNDAYHNVGYFEPNSDAYVMAPVPAEVRELDTKGLIVWSRPMAEFEQIAARYALRIEYGQDQPPQTASIDTSSPDREALRTFSYRLNERGVSIYRLILDTVARQIENAQTG